MKKLFPLALTFLSFSVRAQTPFPTIDFLNINNINASVLVHGDMWWNPATEVSACFYPTGSVKNVNFTGALWMSGYDGSSNLHVAAQTYRQNGNDYWPGPLDSSGTIAYDTSGKWAKIWKIYKIDVDTFLMQPVHTATNTPTSILTWPGKGNTYAAGNGGAHLTVTSEMAPFVDLNGDGIYEPLQGEYPAFPGDEALWWVFNDNGPAHTASNGRPLEVEVHAMSYAYKRGTLIDNVVYYKFEVINKSPANYANMRIALFDDIDLGYYADDFIGFDSVWRMGIDYNGTNCDGCSAGNPANSYGSNPPQSAITMIVQPGDAGTSLAPIGNFLTYNNDFSVIGNPTSDVQYDYYIRGKTLAGAPLGSLFTSGSAPCGGFDSSTDIRYMYPYNPADTNDWNECGCHHLPGDRRFVMSSNDFTFNSGASQTILFALIVADSANGCPDANFSAIQIVADTAWATYVSYALGVPEVSTESTMTVYPNPAHNQLFIENPGGITGAPLIRIYNLLGQQFNCPVSGTGQASVADISALPAGIYVLSYYSGQMQKNVKFVKE